MTQQAAPTVDGADFRAAMAHVPMFASVVTTSGEHGPSGCTANAVLSLSASPPSMLVSLARESRTAAQVVSAGRFAVNVLTWPQRELVACFGEKDPARRFDGVPHEEQDGVPVIAGCSAVLLCELDSTVPMHDHTLLAGTVTWTRHRAEEDPLVLYRRRSHALPQSA
jgi:3-hydroxy-9,10-secoandrosta-1,3,5(10)-triene-9,17-dione monooxygenase reductase component